MMGEHKLKKPEGKGLIVTSGEHGAPAVGTTGDTCATCMWFRPNAKMDGAAGDCVRFPPQVAFVLVPDPEGGFDEIPDVGAGKSIRRPRMVPAKCQGFPMIEATQTCGEWESDDLGDEPDEPDEPGEIGGNGIGH